MIDVTLLGTGGMLPKKNRWLSSCLISCAGHSILIDCGEGTQIALKYAQKKQSQLILFALHIFTPTIFQDYRVFFFPWEMKEESSLLLLPARPE